MTRVHLVFLWHMHQPEYRDPSTGAFVLPWTRLHALKDYWGMVKLIERFPKIHATFNLVPSLIRQIEQYAAGQFHEEWFELAFRPAVDLSDQERAAFLARAFHANHEQVIRRWPRYHELHQRTLRLGALAASGFSSREMRDLQVLSQLAWTDEEYLASHPVVHGLAEKGYGFTEEDKMALKAAQAELLAKVLPEYRRASDRGQIEISVSPFYHPFSLFWCTPTWPAKPILMPTCFILRFAIPRMRGNSWCAHARRRNRRSGARLTGCGRRKARFRNPWRGWRPKAVSAGSRATKASWGERWRSTSLVMPVASRKTPAVFTPRIGCCATKAKSRRCSATISSPT